MSQYWKSNIQYSQLSVEELRENAQRSADKATKKGKELHPVIVEGRQLTKSWWGQAWCHNLEKYADYESRLNRGKRYIRSNAVIDLVIQNGKISARVQGSRKTPYKIEIRISPLKEERCQEIILQCGNRIENMEELINGNFPDELKQLFLGEHGLFPSQREISFQCSCPDWALMCKHVAAVLYGVGVRLDENPFLFFTLRGIEIEQFIDVALENKVEAMLEHANVQSERILEDSMIATVFGLY